MRDYIFFNGKSSAEYGLYVSDAGVYTPPAHLYEKVSVPGRSGDLILDENKFDNVEMVYPMILADDFEANFKAWEAFLLSQKGYCRLEDTFCPDEFYLATFARFDNLKTYINKKAGTASMVFDRKPQRYLKDGEKSKEISSFPAEVMNPTQYEAKPLIRLYGSGTLTIGDVSIVLATSSAYVDIDCDLCEALVAAENLNITTTGGKFPVLSPGKNTITWTGTKIDIKPRYYTI